MQLHFAIAISLVLADHSECIHAKQSDATVIRGNKHALAFRSSEEGNTGDFTTFTVFSIAISTFRLYNDDFCNIN